MSKVLFAGFYTAFPLLGATPDVRVKGVMPGFTGETQEDAVRLADLTLIDEYDGPGYTEYDCANVTAGYDATANEFRIHADSGYFGPAGVGLGTDVVKGGLIYLYVDGTAANDILLAFDDTLGFGVNGNGTRMSVLVPAEGLLRVRKAA